MRPTTKPLILLAFLPSVPKSGKRTSALNFCRGECFLSVPGLIMHAVLLGSVTVIFSLCSARPSEHDTFQNIRLNRSSRTNLSKQNGDSFGDLTLPLSPSRYPHLRSVITYGFDDVPTVFLQLPASIAMNIYDAWKDTANLPIRKAFRNRLNPFDNIEFTTIPSMLPGPVLTPPKIGIASFDMLYQMASLRGWPGHVQAKIFDATVEIGTLKVDYSPLVTGSLFVRSSAYDMSSGLSFTMFQKQQRWLRCFTNVLARLLIQKSPLGKVTDDTHLPPKQIPWG